MRNPARLIGAHVTYTGLLADRTILGTVTDIDYSTGVLRLKVRHFNGEPWPFDPLKSASGRVGPERIMYKELTIDFVLGRTLTLGGEVWRVLEIDPASGKMRLLLCAEGTVRSHVDWPSVQALIADGLLEVE